MFHQAMDTLVWQGKKNGRYSAAVLFDMFKIYLRYNPFKACEFESYMENQGATKGEIFCLDGMSS